MHGHSFDRFFRLERLLVSVANSSDKETTTVCAAAVSRSLSLDTGAFLSRYPPEEYETSCPRVRDRVESSPTCRYGHGQFGNRKIVSRLPVESNVTFARVLGGSVDRHIPLCYRSRLRLRLVVVQWKHDDSFRFRHDRILREFGRRPIVVTVLFSSWTLYRFANYPRVVDGNGGIRVPGCWWFWTGVVAPAANGVNGSRRKLNDAMFFL